METDLDGPVAEAARGASDGFAEECPEPSRLTVSLPHLVPSRLWKNWAAGGVALAALAGLLVAWLFAEEASAAGSPLGDMISPLADRLLRGTGAATWWFAGQLSCLAWWVRSRSRVDYAGRFHAWGWLAAGFFAAAALCLTDAHQLIARLVAWAVAGHTTAAAAGTTAFWLLPSLVTGMALWGTLGSELRDCVASRLLHALAGLAGLLLVGVELWVTRSSSSLQLEFVSRLTLGVLQWCNLMTVLLHVRHVVHVTADPPALRPSWFSVVWDRCPGRMLHWLRQRLSRPSSTRPAGSSEDETLDKPVSTNDRGQRRVIHESADGSTQNVRIDPAEPTGKGSSRRARRAGRR
ncbi:MAG TPA: hypothetical protein VK137_20830 [Planctomycetaceae bacterium]|nr:hypothetical protein [Planctomycetaceae bacterium]